MLPLPRALGVLAVMPLILAAITEPQVVRAAEAPSSDCAETLVAFSPCLPFVSSSPNNLTSSPPPGCCKPVNDAFRTDAACLCHLVFNRSLLGFPLNVTRLVALSSLCRSSPGDNRDDDSSSLSRLCFFRSASSFAHQNEAPAPAMAPETAGLSLAPSATSNHHRQILPGALIVLVMNFCFSFAS
ncbi:non-specific lipid transfer protein GPI-anchored 25-like isoform X2 [Nymphaea colorata]|uniref:non-specific lipid transfer protein GPI-anchored 25-like isoform X2 n=1 Tax=Nymphaea colorata TaxID=210225 RepID=UPI00129D59FD|nr:non-specific lipid transfer protein GPI-anchored 25-like isoform X2 [Nymphaea colorata]